MVDLVRLHLRLFQAGARGSLRQGRRLLDVVRVAVVEGLWGEVVFDRKREVPLLDAGVVEKAEEALEIRFVREDSGVSRARLGLGDHVGRQGRGHGLDARHGGNLLFVHCSPLGIISIPVRFLY